jgi:hypothetical protein
VVALLAIEDLFVGVEVSKPGVVVQVFEPVAYAAAGEVLVCGSRLGLVFELVEEHLFGAAAVVVGVAVV